MSTLHNPQPQMLATLVTHPLPRSTDLHLAHYDLLALQEGSEPGDEIEAETSGSFTEAPLQEEPRESICAQDWSVLDVLLVVGAMALATLVATARHVLVVKPSQEDGVTEKEQVSKSAKKWRASKSWLVATILPLTATLTVPLFLRITDSGLLTDPSGDIESVFVFLGICVVAALAAEQFLERLTSQVLGRVERVETKNTEQDGGLSDIERRVAVLESSGPRVESKHHVESADDVTSKLQELSVEYETVRTKQRGRPSHSRTARMTRIVADMIRTLEATGDDQTPNPTDWLDVEPDKFGQRLAGFALALTSPHRVKAEVVARALDMETKPFSVYWGLRALLRVVESSDDVATLEAVRSWSSNRSFKPGTDRAAVFKSIKDALG